LPKLPVLFWLRLGLWFRFAKTAGVGQPAKGIHRQQQPKYHEDGESRKTAAI
jgi:hypothetical protein